MRIFHFVLFLWRGEAYREIIILRERLGCMAVGPFWTYGLWTILDNFGPKKDLQVLLGVWFIFYVTDSFFGPPSGSWFWDCSTEQKVFPGMFGSVQYMK